jgi:hypothetical protein
MGKTCSFGLGSVSAYQARVRASVALAKFSGSAGSTKRTSMPNCFSVFANRFQVPPERSVEETMLCPASHRFSTLKVVAAWPEPSASAATPPSSAATRFSSTSTVGFMMRV